MRLAGIALAILLIAACPPRRGRVVYVVRPCVVPVVPVENPPLPVAPPPTAKSTDPALEHHLAEWTKKIEALTNLRMELSLKRTDAVFKKDTNYTGVLLYMKPNYLFLRLDNVANKNAYEVYVSDGKVLSCYNGLLKTITEIPLPTGWPFQGVQTAGDPISTFLTRLCITAQLPNNSVFSLFTGMKAKEMQERFDITLIKTDNYYIYLDIKPRLEKDRREFKQLRLALYGPGERTRRIAYLPAKVYILRPNEDTEVWTIQNPQIDLPDMNEKAFKFMPASIKEWKVQRAQPKAGQLEQPKSNKP